MRRHKNLFEKVISFQNLMKASNLAQKGKRFKEATIKFNFRLESELWNLHQELTNGTYQPGQYRHFTIYEPKKRLISAAPYRDRVVHHAIHNILEPIFDPTFIYDSYATRKGKGTHAAIDRFQEFSQKNQYVLKCDVRQYFPSIDRKILLALIEKKISCPKTMNLIQKIINVSMANSLHNQPTNQPTSRYPYWQSNFPIFRQCLS